MDRRFPDAELPRGLAAAWVAVPNLPAQIASKRGASIARRSTPIVEHPSFCRDRFGREGALANGSSRPVAAWGDGTVPLSGVLVGLPREKEGRGGEREDDQQVSRESPHCHRDVSLSVLDSTDRCCQDNHLFEHS